MTTLTWNCSLERGAMLFTASRARAKSHTSGEVVSFEAEGMVVICDNRPIPPARIEKLRRLWGPRHE